ncbi:PREDICTED: translation initiation factor IF-2-like [Ceratotherium simum simum]|uniref:Translation initiation factor IF-2-like n=1 Tax=Ceratotherium simum simum TaxID=73337 RepID=A0ABM1CXX2_CERSS|nr:PREDICTED: translation initiation factor IF-2-like [Ceratotherium simum simum]
MGFTARLAGVTVRAPRGAHGSRGAGAGAEGACTPEEDRTQTRAGIAVGIAERMGKLRPEAGGASRRSQVCLQPPARPSPRPEVLTGPRVGAGGAATASGLCARRKVAREEQDAPPPEGSGRDGASGAGCNGSRRARTSARGGAGPGAGPQPSLHSRRGPGHAAPARPAERPARLPITDAFANHGAPRRAASDSSPAQPGRRAPGGRVRPAHGESFRADSGHGPAPSWPRPAPALAPPARRLVAGRSWAPP